MAIKGLESTECVSVYDPDRKAYREVSIKDLQRQMESLGLTETEIESKVKSLRGGK